jgi:hypothetical protein
MANLELKKKNTALSEDSFERGTEYQGPEGNQRGYSFIGEVN